MASGDLPIFDLTDQGIKLVEEERRRIARDLHDGPAQSLTNVSMRLDIIQTMMSTNPEMAKAELSKINSRVVSLVNEVRRLIYDLRPVAIDEIGLIQSVRDLARKYAAESKLEIRVDADAQVYPVPPARQIAVFRLVQEILNNVRKHAQASSTTISFTTDGHDLHVRVEDDGIGFDPGLIPSGHYGIIGMKERVAYLRGTMVIQSEAGKGSVFTIQLPLG